MTFTDEQIDDAARTTLRGFHLVPTRTRLLDVLGEFVRAWSGTLKINRDLREALAECADRMEEKDWDTADSPGFTDRYYGAIKRARALVGAPAERTERVVADAG